MLARLRYGERLEEEDVTYIGPSDDDVTLELEGVSRHPHIIVKDGRAFQLARTPMGFIVSTNRGEALYFERSCHVVEPTICPQRDLRAVP
jgi:hypothetical protein